jgi:hypothetical protein
MTFEDPESAAMLLAFAIGMFAGALFTVLCDVFDWWLKRKGRKA